MVFFIEMKKCKDIDCILFTFQLKYHDTGKEKDCLPRTGQWNMMNKVTCGKFSFQLFCFVVLSLRFNQVQYSFFWYSISSDHIMKDLTFAIFINMANRVLINAFSFSANL